MKKFCVFFLTAFFLLGCEGFLNILNQNDVYTTCVDIQEHLEDIGCLHNEDCANLISDVISNYVSPYIPYGNTFEVGCDIVVNSGLLPTQCVMVADNPVGVVACIKDAIKELR